MVTNKPTITVRILGKADDAIDAIDGVVGKLGTLGTAGAAAVGTAGLAIGGALVKGTLDALDQNQITDRLAAQLDLSGADAERFGSVAGDLYAQAYGDSFQDATDQLSGVLRTFGEDLSDAEAFGLTAGAIDLTSAFDLDSERLVQTAGVLLNNGLADTAEGALDVITGALQNVNAPAGDVLDTLYEFSEPLASLGLEGEAAIGVIANAADAGVFDLTKAGDALKELSIRAIDGSASTAEAYRTLGLDADALSESLAAGGPAAQQATSDIIQALNNVEDPLAREAAGVALFGTTFEDLGPQAIAALDPMLSTIEDVDGATTALGETLNDNLSTRFEAIKRQVFQGLAQVAENVVLPALEAVLPYIEDFGAELGERLPGYIATAQRWFAAIRPTIESVVDFVIDNWPTVQTTIETAINAVVFAIEEFLLPAAEFLIDEVFTPIFDWVEENWPEIQEAITTALDAILAGFELFSTVVTTLWDLFGDHIIEVIGIIVDTIVPVIQGAFQILEGVFTTFTALIEGDWSGVWNGLLGIFEGAWAIASAAIEGAFDLLFTTIDGILTTITDAITGTWDSVVEEVSGLGTRIADAAIGVFDGVKDAFKDAINFIIDGWNGLSFTLPELDLGLFGSIGPFTISTPDIPRLATGGAVSAPMLAVVGDNPQAYRDPEIVAPQSFIRDAVRDVLEEMGGPGGRSDTVTINATGFDSELLAIQLDKTIRRRDTLNSSRFAAVGDVEAA